jgi:hypothetical protein
MSSNPCRIRSMPCSRGWTHSFTRPIFSIISYLPHIVIVILHSIFHFEATPTTKLTFFRYVLPVSLPLPSTTQGNLASKEPKEKNQRQEQDPGRLQIWSDTVTKLLAPGFFRQSIPIAPLNYSMKDGCFENRFDFVKNTNLPGTLVELKP